MGAPSDRRGFLAGLAALPLVGGGVKILGQPTQAAVPVTDALLRRYVTFIAGEHQMALRELAERETPYLFETHRPAWHPPMYWMPDVDIDMQITMEEAAPSTRAAVVLSAAGVPLDGGLYGNAAVSRGRR